MHDENRMSTTLAFGMLMDGRVGPTYNPRYDPTRGSRSQRRASHPTRNRPSA